MQSYNEGHTAEMLHHEYPTLPLALIYHVLAFYWDNRAEVDSYAAEVEAELDRQEAAYVPGPAPETISEEFELAPELIAEKLWPFAEGQGARSGPIAESGGMSLNLPEFLTRHEKGYQIQTDRHCASDVCSTSLRFLRIAGLIPRNDAHWAFVPRR